MANKNVNADKAKQKWEAFQNIADAPLQRMIAGTATPVDIQRAAVIVSKFESLASQVFLDGIHTVESTTDALLDEANRRRTESKKRPLTIKAQERIWNTTFQRVMKEQAKDIIGTVHDIMIENFEDEDAVASAETQDKMFDLLKRVAADRGHDVDDDTRDEFDYNPMGLRTRLNPDVVDEGGYTPNSPIVALDPNVQTTLLDALTGQQHFHSEVLEELSAVRDQEQQEEEKKKKDKERSWFGRFTDWYKKMKGSKAAGWIQGLISTLLSGLALAIVSPGLVKSLSEAVGEYVTVENFAKLGSWVLEKLGQAGKLAVDGIARMLGINQDGVKWDAAEIKKRNDNVQKDKEAWAQVVKSAPERLRNSENNIKAAETRLQEIAKNMASGKLSQEEGEKRQKGAQKELADATNQRNMSYYQAHGKMHPSVTVTPSDVDAVNNQFAPGSAQINPTNMAGFRTPTANTYQGANKPALGSGVYTDSGISYDPNGVIKPEPVQSVVRHDRGGNNALQASHAIGLGAFANIPSRNSDLMIMTLGMNGS